MVRAPGRSWEHVAEEPRNVEFFGVGAALKFQYVSCFYVNR